MTEIFKPNTIGSRCLNNHSQNVTGKVTNETFDQLTRVSKDYGISRSYLVRQLIDFALEHIEEQRGGQ